MSARCQHEGCPNTSIGCRYVDTPDDDPPDEHLCHEHASAAGFCGICGRFSDGTDGFNRHGDGLCEVCSDQLAADYDDDGDEEWEDEYDEPHDDCS